MPNKDLYDKIIIYIGDIEDSLPYFEINKIKIDGYADNEVEDYVKKMIEGEIIQGIYADDGQSENYGYLVGGLTTETKYYYHQLKRDITLNNKITR
ncbi:hypothetical protein [Haloplasma contractile]|uniref:Uncharacterized protein n=1 Tax=Haloplasma contractile SSD-17B TaxID=1033810 RepID=U2FR37_9MOLU|nr:hypothetical protein [Haloplasma contractile]ERJ13459.1 hypothetical protein HLPCO_000110 [Haloplasma contractile SSD-17B]